MSSSRSSSPQVLNDNASAHTSHASLSEHSSPHQVEQRFSPSPINFLPTAPLLFQSPPMSPRYGLKPHLQDSNENILLVDQEMNMMGSNLMTNPNAIMRVGLSQFKPLPQKADSFFNYHAPADEVLVASLANSYDNMDNSNQPHHDEIRTSATSPSPSIDSSSSNRKTRTRSVVPACADPELELQRRRRLDRKAELARVSRQQRNEYVNLLNEKLLLIKNRLLLYEDEFGNCRNPDYGAPMMPHSSTPTNKVQPLITGRKRSIDQAKSRIYKIK